METSDGGMAQLKCVFLPTEGSELKFRGGILLTQLGKRFTHCVPSVTLNPFCEIVRSISHSTVLTMKCVN